METIHLTYTGELMTESIHLKSGKSLITDAPTDNQGKGSTFSPTDLLTTSLGACMATVMGIAARTHSIKIEDMKLKLTKIMASNPRRVSEIKIEFDMPQNNFTDKEKTILETAARTCPVALSLHPDLKQDINFNW
ncbi:MAG: OsmC family peroxiredoxin [Bacteroidetes bacterium]|nr:MAG: OsmC family peroxiredoxin [Bacteroidota bacterium]REK06658.1 MAG: OsmC family peroxiredoxin [Bacteroidota bacterium]REK33424.1 MAG: OsmC family peroxiredoxin [Bacteroidota bacterium]REK49823.1 MAG: OsmC family peroxiredoxin [Bacteroidota bacterium]